MYWLRVRSLKNCLTTFGPFLQCGGTGAVEPSLALAEWVACLELRFYNVANGFPVISEIKGPKNNDVPSPVLHAVYKWLLTWQQFEDQLDARYLPERPIVSTYQRLMKPYWLEKGLTSWLPLNCGDMVFADIRKGLRLVRNVTC